MPSEPNTAARTKFIPAGKLTEGIIKEVQVNQDPFHCVIRIQPLDPMFINAEGRYSDHEISLGKLKRNLVALKFNIEDLEDIIAAVESLEGRECIFRVDKSGWVSWIPRLIQPAPIAPDPAQVPVPTPVPKWEDIEVFLIREPGFRSVYRMENRHGGVLAWAVGPTHQDSPTPHGWVLNLVSRNDAIEVIKNRKKSLDK